MLTMLIVMMTVMIDLFLRMTFLILTFVDICDDRHDDDYDYGDDYDDADCVDDDDDDDSPSRFYLF